MIIFMLWRDLDCSVQCRTCSVFSLYPSNPTVFRELGPDNSGGFRFAVAGVGELSYSGESPGDGGMFFMLILQLAVA